MHARRLFDAALMASRTPAGAVLLPASCLQPPDRAERPGECHGACSIHGATSARLSGFPHGLSRALRSCFAGHVLTSIASHATLKEHFMNNDQVKGDIKQAKGKVKEVAGRIFGDKSLENKGRIQNAAGKVQKSYGNLKEEIKSGK